MIDGVAESELHCGSHVEQLLTKLPLSYRDNFADYCLSRGTLRSRSNRTYTLFHLAEWLERPRPKPCRSPDGPWSCMPQRSHGWRGKSVGTWKPNRNPSLPLFIMDLNPQPQNHLLWPIQVQRLLQCRRKENISSLTALSVKGQSIT